MPTVDWGNCPGDRKSYSGYVFTFEGAAISWEAKKQQTVALSTVEAEYMALTEAANEAIHLGRSLTNLRLSTSPVHISCDSQGANRLAENPMYHSRTKQIDIKHHFVRECLKN